MSNTYPFKKQLISLSVAATLASTSAFAAMLEEVIVTAQKRAQSVNDISISASAYTGNQLQAMGVDSAVDLGAFTPGLVTVNSTSGGTPIFAIRGIGLDDFSANNTSGVGVYADEVFASNPAFLSGQLFDIERVEVLKGPQGTLYGRNTTGGAINFITNKPADEFEAYVDVGVGRYSSKEFTAVVSGAITGDVIGRLSVNIAEDDGWQNDAETGNEFGGEDTMGVRGIVNFPFGDGGSATIKTYYSSDESTPVSPQVSGLGDSLGDPSFDALNSAKSATAVNVGTLPVARDENGSGIALTLEYSFDNFNVVSITAIDSYEREVVDNYGGSSAAILDLYQDNEMDQWSQEVRFVSNDDFTGFSWVAGVNISGEKVAVVDTFDDSFLVSDSVAVDFVLDPADIALQGADLLTADYTQETDSYGLYLHTETELKEGLRLTLGARYSYDNRSFEGVSTNYDADNSFNDTVALLDEEHDEEAVTGKIGLDWDYNENILVYSSVSNSYKSGAFYGAAILDDISWAYVEPEDVISYEVGFKATLFDSSLQLNGAAFMLEYENRQSLVTIVVDDFSNFLEFPVADTTLINIPESEIQGFELDMRWAATDNLTVAAGVAYLDTKVTKAPTTEDMRGINADASVNDLADGSTIPFVDALAAPLPKGVSLSQSPEWSYNAMISYDIAVGTNYLLNLQSSYSRTEEISAQLADANAITGPLDAWNAKISLSDRDEVWTASAWVKNIEDNSAESYAFTSFAGRSYYSQAPTSYGINLRYNF